MNNAEIIDVTIVLPALNEERYLKNCLDSLMKLDFPKEKLEIILVDNGSTDNTLQIAKAYPIKVLENPNAKVGAVRNLGAHEAQGRFIVFLDSDCTTEPNWLSKGISKLLQNPDTVLGGQCILRENPYWLEKYWILNNSKTRAYQTTLIGACIFIDKSLFFKVGGFDESLNSGEDCDLTVKLKKAGAIVDIDPSMSVIHLGFPTEIIPFIKRQIWHSSDYAQNSLSLYKDKIFILTLIFITGVIGTAINLITNNSANYVFLLCVFCPPLVLSCKRVLRSQFNHKSLWDYASIYLIDWLYITGRALGAIISFKNALVSRKGKVYSR